MAQLVSAAQFIDDAPATYSAASYETESVVLEPHVLEGLRNLADTRRLPLPTVGAALFALLMCRGVHSPGGDFGLVPALNEDPGAMVLETDPEESCLAFLARVSSCSSEIQGESCRNLIFSCDRVRRFFGGSSSYS